MALMWLLLLSSGVLVAADRFTKSWASRVPGRRMGIIRSTRHRFASRAIASRPGILVVVWSMALAAVVAGIESGFLFQMSLSQLALGAALGGAASNLYDRLRWGAVIDFIDFGWWPVFNLADAGITAGVVVALWLR